VRVLLLIIATVAAAAVWWPRLVSFDQRFVSMPPAMSWDTITKARKAAGRPAGMTYTYCKYPDCKRG